MCAVVQFWTFATSGDVFDRPYDWSQSPLIIPSHFTTQIGYAKKNDLKIIGAGDYKTFYDEGFIDLTPYEWVDLFRNAEKVITGTFHGTVFSIKYNKSVLCYPTEKNRINKIRSLLSDMKIASRLLEVGCEDDFIPLLDTPMDYTETRNYIAQKIQEADDFLTGDKS